MKEKCVGYIKYEGALVKGGMMDARKQGQALLAVDHALRHFIAEQIYDHVHDRIHDNKVHDNKVHDKFRNKIHKEVHDIGFEIPVKVKEGSWELQLIEWGLNLLGSGVDIAANAYMVRLGCAIADWHWTNIKDLFKKSADMIKWSAKIATHLGSIYVKPDKKEKHPNNKSLVVIINNEGEKLDVPKDVLDKYIRYDGSKLLKALVDIIEEGRSLRIGLKGESGDIIIDSNGKVRLVQPKPPGDMLFPELKHGKTVILEGEVVSENKKSNSMGFEYKGHVLTAYPENNTIVSYRDAIFRRCNLNCVVCRKDSKGGTTALKPKLHFTGILPA